MRLWSILFIMGIIVTSCLNSDEDFIEETNSGRVAFNNFSPDSNGLKFYSNGEVIPSNSLDYGDYYGFWPGEVGIHSITVNSGSTVLDTLDLTIGLNRYYSVFAVNNSSNLELISFEENFIIPSPGKAAIHFYQLSPDAPQMRVELAGNTSKHGTYLFKQASTFMEVNETLNKRLYLINNTTNDTIFSKNVTFSNGESYSVVSKGYVNTTIEDQEIDIQVIPFN